MFTCRAACAVMGVCAWLCIMFPVSAQYHSADTDGDYIISLSELLRAIQFINLDGLHCEAGTEDGYAPGPGDTACVPHSSDYTPQNWRFNLSEVVRAIQFYNSNGYHTQCHSEDTFAPGPGSHESCDGEQYTLRYSAAGTGSISGISPQTVVYGGSGTAVTAMPDPHCHFVRWSDGRTDNPRTDVYVRTDITVTAWFAAGGIVYVAQGGTGDGSSWDSPLGSIQDGVDAAEVNGEVWVAAGTYTATTNPVVTMKEGVALYGGFAGTETGRDERDWITNATIIDGENARRCVIGANNVTLDGFTITHGSVIGGNGAGMYNYDASPVVTNCTFTENSAHSGGGMYNNGATPSVTNCTFTGNSASNGGGMYNSDASPMVTNCTFTGNSAIHSGGGMCNYEASPSLTNCIFMENLAEWYGGGMYNGFASPSLTNCTFTSNSAGHWGCGMYNIYASPSLTHCAFTDNLFTYRGGGIYNYYSSPSLTNCTFTSNTAISGGGMSNDYGSSPSLTNCTFTANSALQEHGGGMCNADHSSPSLTNCIFTGNSANAGGGMYNYDHSSPSLINCTFTENSSPYHGGGMYNSYYSMPSVTNCILWGDSSEIDNSMSSPIVMYSCVQGDLVYPGTGNINTDPLFVDGTAGNVQLLAGSPCEGAGTANGAPTIDILGHLRPIHTGTVTMGAYEGTVDPGSLVYLTIEIAPEGCDATTWPAAGSSYAFVQGDNAVVLAKPGASMHFVSWSDELTGTQPIMIIAMDRNKTITANFAINQYTLTYTAGAHGSISGDSPQTVDYGESGTMVTAVPDDGYIFKHWSDGSTDNPRTDINVMDDITVKALFSIGWIVYVTPDGTGDGTSWASPFGSLQDAVDFAMPGDEVWVAAGTYTAMTDPVVTMKEGLPLYGGFAGTETEREERDWTANVTVIDGENARRCVVGANNATLDGFTITNGKTTYNGGGMYNNSATPNVTNCTFLANSADYGGGMFNWDTSPVVTNCTFMGNSAGCGGGMYNHSSSPSVTNCIFTSNLAHLYGGGMYNYRASPVVTNCMFTENSANYEGGGMYNYGSSPSVTNCTFTGNSANNLGGGMHNENCSPNVANCIFMGNSANWGGGMFNYEASPNVSNCTFTGNTADVGGGMRNSYYSAPVVTNCILWGDSSEIYNDTSSPLITYSCVQGGYDGDGNINTDPQFVSAPEDLHLQDGSPCIDSGTAEGAPATDIEGVARPQGGGVDMGAYER